MDGSRIRELRKSKGISLTKLSELTGVSKSYLSCLERNQNNPSIDVLEKISDRLEVNVNYFISNQLADHEIGKSPDKSIIKLEIEVSNEEIKNLEKYEQLQKLLIMFKK